MKESGTRRRPGARAGALALAALVLVSANAQAQDISDLLKAYSSLLGTSSGSDSGSASDSILGDAGSSTSDDILGNASSTNALQTSLLKALMAASPLPTVRPASPAPALTLCPVCGASFPFSAASPGRAWGMRLDLRLSGPVTDPPTLAVCPHCGFPVYAKTIAEPALSRLRAFVSSEEFKRLDARNQPYYRLALIREKRLVPLPDGDYDIAHAYLQAAWQAEDSGDAEAVSLYLRKALQYVRSFAASCPLSSPYYATSRLLPVELLRRLGRFAEARMALDSFKDQKAFKAAYLQRIIASEGKLIDVENSAPAASP